MTDPYCEYCTLDAEGKHEEACPHNPHWGISNDASVIWGKNWRRIVDKRGKVLASLDTPKRKGT